MSLSICQSNLSPSNEELKPHGTVHFPCAGYRDAYEEMPGFRVPWHWHDEMEIIYAKAGAVCVRIPAKTYRLLAGDCLVINSGILHEAVTEPDGIINSLVFSPSLISGSDESAISQKYIKPLVSNPAFRDYKFSEESDPELVQDFMTAYSALADDTPGYEFTVRNKLSEICYALCREFEHTENYEASDNADDLRIRNMLDFINENYASDMNLSEIARAGGIGERECLRCFQRTIQLSPMQYLMKYRIAKGAELLISSPGKSVSDIASECGFNSPSNFSKIFKRYFASSPRKYRSARLNLTAG